jgi:hypothetical protein
MIKCLRATTYNAYYGEDVERVINRLIDQFNELSNVTYLDMQIVVVGNDATGVLVYRENPVQAQKDEEIKKPWIGMQRLTEPKIQQVDSTDQDWFIYNAPEAT